VTFSWEGSALQGCGTLTQLSLYNQGGPECLSSPTGFTWLYLGLIHFTDRISDAARVTAVRWAVADFRIASKYGWGGTDRGRVPCLLASHRRAAEVPT
jgi:hypothetical protein